ncbi:hypothetical protein BC827DRAFT_322929 [Russula dissimulans]|nr:hypothetical protein BC827DRAFT_322929 [Russula dissimulans]
MISSSSRSPGTGTAMSTFTFPLKYRRKSSPPPSPRMLSPIAPFSSVSPQSKWLDSDDDFDHEPALTSDDALTVFSSSCSRAPSLAPLDTEDTHVDIVSSPVRETFFRPHPSRAPLSRHNKPYSTVPKPSTTREDVAAALLSLHAQPRLGPSRPGLAQLPTQTESAPPPPARRSRVVTPSLRNLVLPRTPSPPPRPSLLLTIPNQLIDHGPVHAPPPPAQRTPSRRATPASSPLPPSSPFAEEADSEASEPTTFHFVPCPKPKLELFQAHTPPDHSETDNRVPPWSRDDQSKEACNILPSTEHEVPPATSYELSPLTEAAPNPNERHLADEHHSCAPPVIESSPALSPKSADLREILLPINGTRQSHGSRPETPVSAALSSPVQAREALPEEGLFPRIANKDSPRISSSFSRAASSALTALDDEHSTPPSPPRDRCPASSPLTSPPSSPPPSQWCETEPRLAAAAGTKRRTSTPLGESDPAAPSALPGPPRSHTKRRRKDADSDNKPWRSRKKQSPAPVPAPQPSPPASVRPPILASSFRPSSSSSSSAATSTSTFNSDSTHIDTTATASASPTTDTTPDGPDGTNDTKLPTAGGHDDDDDDQPCPHPALLGTLIEALALSRASSLPLSTLTRTNPALAGYPHTALTSTLAWAVRSRILGCVRSSGEALPPSYFYDHAADPDRERGELLRCLMPRAGKRRETMKYKQYYWAPVVVGRGRTRTWDVDWEE